MRRERLEVGLHCVSATRLAVLLSAPTSEGVLLDKCGFVVLVLCALLLEFSKRPGAGFSYFTRKAEASGVAQGVLALPSLFIALHAVTHQDVWSMLTRASLAMGFALLALLSMRSSLSSNSAREPAQPRGGSSSPMARKPQHSSPFVPGGQADHHNAHASQTQQAQQQHHDGKYGGGRRRSGSSKSMLTNGTSSSSSPSPSPKTTAKSATSATPPRSTLGKPAGGSSNAAAPAGGGDVPRTVARRLDQHDASHPLLHGPGGSSPNSANYRNPRYSPAVAALRSVDYHLQRGARVLSAHVTTLCVGMLLLMACWEHWPVGLGKLVAERVFHEPPRYVELHYSLYTFGHAGAALLLFDFLMVHLPRSFTAGEGILVSQAVTVLLFAALSPLLRGHVFLQEIAAALGDKPFSWQQHTLPAAAAAAASAAAVASDDGITSALKSRGAPPAATAERQQQQRQQQLLHRQRHIQTPAPVDSGGAVATDAAATDAVILICCSALLGCFLLWVLFRHRLHKQWSRQPVQRTTRAVGISFASGLAATGIVAVLAVLAAWTLLVFVADSWLRPAALAYWGGLLVGVLAVMRRAARSSSVPQIVLRKGYHLLAVALFLPVLLVDPPMLRLSLAVALAALMALEVLRCMSVPVLGPAVQGFMQDFVDQRDSGPIYVTHFTLLLGLAAPVWLSAAVATHAGNDVIDGSHGTTSGAGGHVRMLFAALSGMMILGFGDSAASVVGRAFGRTPMYAGARKTWEGTCAGVLSTMLAWLLLLAALHSLSGLLPAEWLSLAACTIGAGLLEAVTSQLDNLVVPVYYLAHILTV